MKNKVKVSGIFVLAVMLWASACKKSSTNNSPVALALEGTWMNTVNITDKNGDHKIDSGDVFDTISSGYLTVYYNNDNGVLERNDTVFASFAWSLLDNGTEVEIISNGSPATVQHIDSLTASVLILRDTSSALSNYSWQLYYKQ